MVATDKFEINGLEKKVVIKQDWIESERGWGTRPDGFFLHKNTDDLGKFVNQYWARMPDETPDEYSSPEGNPKLMEVKEKICLAVLASENGCRYYSSRELDPTEE